MPKIVSRHYYNEFDPHAAQWLRNLMEMELIPFGEVDERSILDVTPNDLKGYTQCHFFAGIGGWAYALKLAGWPEDRPVWTGSCPCQPFSTAGKQEGVNDERHIWPEMFRLVRERKPVVVFGEQVESAVGHGWFDGVFADLEGENYACGAAVLGAHSVGAPHIRQRLYWVADSKSVNRRGFGNDTRNGAQRNGGNVPDENRSLYWTEHASRDGRDERRSESNGRSVAGRCGNYRMADPSIGDAFSKGLQRSGIDRFQSKNRRNRGIAEFSEFPTNWNDCEFVPCEDGKSRRVESGLSCLVDGVPFRLADGRTGEGSSRVQILKGLGNAIVPQVAAQFVMAFLDSQGR